MEARLAADALDDTVEMNGFLKFRERISENPLAFANGAIAAIEIPTGFHESVKVPQVLIVSCGAAFTFPISELADQCAAHGAVAKIAVVSP